MKAHGVMMRGLLRDAGCFRQKPVGVVDNQSGEVIHLGTLPAYVPETVEKLLHWTKTSDLHPLVKSCIFHYEFELIHPFLDGNGRCGRLWHTLILSKWNAVFAWLPVESMIYRFQEEYYKAINACNVKCDSTEFIEFMLAIIKLVLTEANQTSEKVAIEKLTDKATGKSQKHFEKLYYVFGTDRIFGRNDVAGICALSYSAAGKIIVKLKEYELIEAVKGKGKGKYKFKQKI